MASLRGRVVEYYTGRAVSGVLVTLDGQTAVTGADGYFTFSDVPPRGYTLQAIHRDFQAYSTALNLPQNVSYNLTEPIRVLSVVRPL